MAVLWERWIPVAPPGVTFSRVINWCLKGYDNPEKYAREKIIKSGDTVGKKHSENIK